MNDKLTRPGSRAGYYAPAMLSLAFVLAECALWVCVQIDFGKINDTLDYLSVILAALFGLLTAIVNPKGEWLVRLGLLFTVVADYYLVYVNPNKELLGVSIFNFAQASYFIYLLLLDPGVRERVTHVTLRILTIGVSILVCHIALGEDTDLLAVVSAVYFANLAVNVFWCLKKRKMLLFAGLVAFLLCDVFVGLRTLLYDYVDVERSSLLWKMIKSDFDFIWFFYVPSQTLIALFTLGAAGKGVFAPLTHKLRGPRKENE